MMLEKRESIIRNDWQKTSVETAMSNLIRSALSDMSGNETGPSAIGKKLT